MKSKPGLEDKTRDGRRLAQPPEGNLKKSTDRQSAAGRGGGSLAGRVENALN